MARGAVIVILSDGWSAATGAGRPEMERLAAWPTGSSGSTLASGASGFSVQAGGMKAALDTATRS